MKSSVKKIRNRAFWSLDSYKGGMIKKQHEEIKFLIENPASPKAIQKKRDSLTGILQHAFETVDFYKSLQKTDAIQDFPIVNKNIIRDNFQDFEAKKYKNSKKRSVSTSGSTGTPFKTYQNKEKQIRNTADTIYFSEKSGFTVGNRLFYFRLWNAFEKGSTLSNTIKNIVPINVFELEKEENIEKLIKTVSKSKTADSWLGYASSYERICKYLDSIKSGKIENNIQSIIAMSERLNTYTKNRIYHYFNTEVVSRYSNVENGILAQQPIGNKSYFEINEASYFIEVLEFDSDTRVKDGKPGRIVITDYFNYCVPMIRYDTGDVGIKSRIDGKPVLVEISGRKIDQIYNTKGELITTNLMLLVNKFPEFKQCQLIQKNASTYKFKINTDKEFLRKEHFTSSFKEFLGDDAQIIFEYVNEIPLLASGKRRVMVNEMNT